MFRVLTGVPHISRLARAFVVALGLLPALLASQPVNAQEPKPARTVVTGQVLDSESRQPVAGALVELAGTRRQTFADKDGRFALKDMATGSYVIVVEQLGYAEARVTRVIDEHASPIAILLAPDPIMLRAIQVTNDRFRRRRNAVASSVFAYDADQIRQSGAWDAEDFVRRHVFTWPCPDRMLSTCIMRRGRVIQPSVYIDDAPVFGGMDFLVGLNPNDLYLVEIYDRGAHIRVYTNWFARRLAAGRARLTPVIR